MYIQLIYNFLHSVFNNNMNFEPENFMTRRGPSRCAMRG